MTPARWTQAPPRPPPARKAPLGNILEKRDQVVEIWIPVGLEMSQTSLEALLEVLHNFL